MSNVPNQITSGVLGTLYQDKQFAYWWHCDGISIPFFDGMKMPVLFMDFDLAKDSDFILEAENALTNFLQLNSADRFNISSLLFTNCMDFLREVGSEETDAALWEMKHPDEVWKFAHFSQITLTRRPYKEKDMYLVITGNCDWEQEHGIQLVFRQGKKLTRVSSQDGHITEADARGISDEQDELHSKF